MEHAILALTLITLAACAGQKTPEMQLAEDQTKCTAMGFKSGTEGFSNCLLMLDIDHRAANREYIGRIQSDTAATIRTNNQTTQCVQFGC